MKLMRSRFHLIALLFVWLTAYCIGAIGTWEVCMESSVSFWAEFLILNKTRKER